MLLSMMKYTMRGAFAADQNRMMIQEDVLLWLTVYNSPLLAAKIAIVLKMSVQYF